MLTEAGTRRGELLQQYVTARITRLDDVNLALFDYDRYNTLYFFALNADETIYLRYGGRDERSATTYLDLDSLELALEQGLELHRLHQRGQLPSKPVPPALHARDIPALYERTIGRGRCVECHLVGDLLNLQRERDGTLDKVRHLYRAPDLRTIGIDLDIPRGLRVAGVRGAVAEAGMRAGDTIRALNSEEVWTFADFQWAYGNVPHDARSIEIAVERDGRSQQFQVMLPVLWWLTDLTYRNLSVDPRVYFTSDPLEIGEKVRLGFPSRGFASRVRAVDSLASLLASHDLQPGDIIYGVDGETTDEVADRAELHIKLRKQAGQTVTLQVLRADERLELPLKTARMSFRK